MLKFVVGLLFLGFAAIHGGYEPTPQPVGGLSYWKSNYGDSWALSRVLPAEGVKVIAAVLWAGATVGFIITGFSVMGFLAPTNWWQITAFSAATMSLLLAIFFWHPWEWLSALIDAVMMVALIVAPEALDKFIYG